MLFCTRHIFCFLKEFLPCVFYVLIVHGSGIRGMETRAARRENRCKKNKIIKFSSCSRLRQTLFPKPNKHFHRRTARNDCLKDKSNSLQCYGQHFKMTLCSRLMPFAQDFFCPTAGVLNYVHAKTIYTLFKEPRFLSSQL